MVNPRPFDTRIVPRDYAEAAKWYLAAAENGNMFAQYELADLYVRGLGVPQDYRQALHWFEKAALQEAWLGVEEHVEALFMIWEQGEIAYRIGLIFADTQGDVLDYAAARKWFLNAAVQGHYGALYELGQMYENGWGVPQSYYRASRFYYKAIGGADYFGYVTDARAYLALADLSSCGKTIYGNKITAVWLYQKVDDLPDAQYALANAYLYGDGTRQSPAKAYYYAKMLSQNPDATLGQKAEAQLIMDEMAAHLPDDVVEWVTVRQFMVGGVDFIGCRNN